MRIPVLDHGYVEFIEAWGHGLEGQDAEHPDFEVGIIEAARQSTEGSFRGWHETCKACLGYGHIATKQSIDDGYGEVDECPTCHGECKVPVDEKLLGYLHRNRHDSPFEFAGMIIEVQAPIMVFREWHRHRTQSYNEMSGRYIELPELSYIPSMERLLHGGQSKSNTQASGVELSYEFAERAAVEIRNASADARESYRRLLDSGIARELARLVLPVNQYSRMRASANLRNWLAFLTLRQAENAQWEIRQYANAVATIIEQEFPRTYALHQAGRP